MQPKTQRQIKVRETVQQLFYALVSEMASAWVATVYDSDWLK